MTVGECKKLLEGMRSTKKRARQIRNEINEIERDIAALQLRSTLGKVEEIRASGVSRTVERIVERLDQKRRDLEESYNELFAMEDKLAAAIQELPDDERDIIIDYYMRDRSIINIATNSFFCSRTVLRKKKSAIGKVARRIN